MQRRLAVARTDYQEPARLQNLFDTDPPFVNRSTGYAYDVGNADPLDRFVALQLIKSW